MSETFRDLSPTELHATLIQFMGQNIGEIKKLDSDILDKNNTLRGLTLQPEAILRSLPTQPVPPPQPLPVQSLPQQAVQIQPMQQVVNTPQIDAVENSDQLLFDFINDVKNDPSLKDTIKLIEKRVATISDISASLYNLNKKVDQIIDSINDPQFKKKID
jgi:hypothetical protein